MSCLPWLFLCILLWWWFFLLFSVDWLFILFALGLNGGLGFLDQKILSMKMHGMIFFAWVEEMLLDQMVMVSLESKVCISVSKDLSTSIETKMNKYKRKRRGGESKEYVNWRAIWWEISKLILTKTHSTDKVFEVHGRIWTWTYVSIKAMKEVSVRCCLFGLLTVTSNKDFLAPLSCLHLFCATFFFLMYVAQ